MWAKTNEGKIVIGTSIIVGSRFRMDEQTVCAGRESDKKNYEGREKDS